MLRVLMPRSIIIAAICAVSFAASGFADGPQRIEVPAGDLVAALESLAKQAKVNLVYQATEMQGIRTEGVSGTLTPQEAVAKLLKGTSLRLSTDRITGAMMISSASSISSISPSSVLARESTAPENTPREPVVVGQPLRLAEVARDVSEFGRESGKPRSEIQLAEAADAKQKSPKSATPEMLVEGSKIINADIERTEDDIQPYVVFDREQIKRSHATNLEEFLKIRLPMNTVSDTQSQGESGLYGNTSSINLRGLGTHQTLVLVDGRRMPRIADLDNINFRQPDINGIPLASIERIEVLPATAGGIFGGDATGGVVNIVTRRDYTGLNVGVTYGNTFNTDTKELRVDANGGFSLEDGRTRISVNASYSESNPLQVHERDFAAESRALQFINNPSAFFSDIVPPGGHTSNVRNFFPNENVNLVLDNGTELSSPFTFVPSGYAGPATDGGAALAVNAGQYDLGIPNNTTGLQGSLLSNPVVDSVSLSLRREFSNRVEAFFDMTHLNNEGRVRRMFGPTFALLPADAPNNPFTTDIIVSFPVLVETSFPTETKSETRRVSGGLIVHLPREWTAAFDYTWSRSRYSMSSSSPTVGDPDGDGPGAPIETALSDGTLDVLRDINVFPLDYSPYLLSSPNSHLGPFDTVLNDAAFRLSGPVVELPAGTVVVSGTIGRREEEAREGFENAPDRNVFRFFPSASQDVSSYYVEAHVPLISEKNALPGIRSLALQASVRRDEYETRSSGAGFVSLPSSDSPVPDVPYSTNEVSAAKYTAGFRYSPLRDIALRASYGTGFLPPSLNQINRFGPFDFFAIVSDSRRNNTPSLIGPIDAFSGGNSSLRAEDSESWSAGVILTPRYIPDLRFSVDYTQIKKRNEIAILSTQQLLDFEDSIPNRVLRAPLTPEDESLGYTGGAITGFDLSSVNFAVTRLEAYDIQIDYAMDTGYGEFQMYAVATWQPHFQRKTLPSSPLIDFVGFNRGPLEWRGNAGLSWERERWTLGWNAQYFDSYFIYGAGVDPVTVEMTVLNQGSATVPEQIYHDAFATFRPGQSTFLGGIFSDLEISVAIKNVFDKSPPIFASTSGGASYSMYGDPRLRRYSISIRKSL